MLHYNFPPFSTGETKPMRGPGRREIGHGALAERALVRMMPDEDKFPYTIRIVSARRSSRTARRRWPRSAAARSRSWTRACRSSRRSPASRWVSSSEGDDPKIAVLSATSSATRITSATWTSRSAAPRKRHHRHPDGHQDRRPLARRSCSRRSTRRARAACTSSARCSETLATPRAGALASTRRASPPIKVKPDQIRVIIGPGGKTIKGIIDQTGVAIDVEDDGTVNIASRRHATR